jgi:hypothetical protein
MKLYVPPRYALGSDDMVRRLRDMQANQAVRRVTQQLTGLFDVKELRYLARKAHDLFGSWGVVEFDGQQRGIAKMGYFIDPPRTGGGAARRAVYLFEGHTSEEICQQIRTWELKRT